MDERAREILYKQLVEMAELNIKSDAEEIITRESFFAMPEEDVLKYVFDYRDQQTSFEVGGKKATYYIELPDINLNGRELSKTYLSRFILSYENDEGKRVASNVDLGDTNVTINLTDIGYSELGTSERRTDEEIIDFEKVDFTGCNLFGTLPDVYQSEDITGLRKRVIVKGRENLDDKYVDMQYCRLSYEDKMIADRAYRRLLNGESFYRMIGNKKTINLTGYDLTIVEDIKNFCENYRYYDIKGAYFPNGKLEEVLSKMRILEAYKLLRDLSDTYQVDTDEKRKKILQGMTRDDILPQYIWETSYPTNLYMFRNLLMNEDIKVFLSNEVIKNLANDLILSDAYTYTVADLKSHLLSRIFNEEREFVKQHFRDLSSENQMELINSMETEERINFIEQNFRELKGNSKSDVLDSMKPRERVEFRKRHFEELDLEDRKKTLKLMKPEEKKEFLKNHFGTLEEADKSKLLESMQREERIEFMKQHFGELHSYYKHDLIRTIPAKEKFSFMKQHFGELYSYYHQRDVIIEMAKQGDREFVEQHYSKLYEGEDKRDVMIEMAKQRDREFVEQHYSKLYEEDYQRDVMIEMAKQGYMKFVDEHFGDLDSYYQRDVMREMLKQGNVEFVTNHQGDLVSYIEHEKKTTEMHGKKEVSTSGKLLNTLLKDENFNKDMVLKLIEIGSGVDYVDYSNKKGKITYTPTLYLAMQIKDEEVRKEVVTAMLEAGANPIAKKLELEFVGGECKSRKEEWCLSMNDGELRRIEQSRKTQSQSRPLTQPEIEEQTGIPKSSQTQKYHENQEQSKEQVVEEMQPQTKRQELRLDTFLRDDVGLSSEDIEAFKRTYSQYGIEPSTLSPARLEVKGRILEACGGKKELFTKNSQATMLSEDVLYARLMFFKEQKIEIRPEELDKTIALPQKQFVSLYGAKLGVFRGRNDDTRSHIRNVTKKLKKVYPMPKTYDELKRKLEEINVSKEV